jgi:hypothetical protein
MYKVVGLLRRTTLAVDSRCGYLIWQPSCQPCHARNIERLLADLRNTAANDLAYILWPNIGSRQHGFLHDAEQK